MKFTSPVFRKLCDTMIKKHKVTIRCDHENDLGWNQCWVAGRDIWVSLLQESEEELMLGIMHEIGHLLYPYSRNFQVNFSTYMKEYECWVLGIKEAMDHGVLFREELIHKALTKHLGSYVGHTERESEGWEFRQEVPKGWRREYLRKMLEIKTPSWVKACGYVLKEIAVQMWAVIKDLN